MPSNSVVVLVSGIAGDVESETQYRQELQAWLDLLRTTGRAERVIILADRPGNPETNGLTNPQVLQTTREAFLGLGQTLKSGANPLLVVVWGHGGMQGATPVFHVRGPRVTPEDFVRVAEGSRAANSRWILLFKGSGAFANQLAKKDRLVLASEATTRFATDPVGMRILLELVRENPFGEFAELCKRFEERTAQWYAERNLAQTEEPTLWTHNGPQPSASEATADANTSPRNRLESSTEQGLTTAESEQSQPSRTNAQTALTQHDRPDAWLQAVRQKWGRLQAVDPLDYAGHDGVMLSRRVSYTLGSSPAVSSEQEEFIQILTPEGKHLGDFDVSYSPPFEELVFLDCEVLRPDGELIRLDLRSVREAQDRTVGQFSVGRRKVFSLPGVVPGAIVHVRYRSQWRDFPLPHAYLELPLQSDIPVLTTTVQVTAPKDGAFHYAIDQVSAPEPQLTHSEYGKTFTWKLEHLPARKRSVLSPPDRDPALIVSTFPDWAAFARWYSRIIRLSDEITPEIKLKAEELTRGARTERDKVLALYDHVTRMRYVAVPIGISSLRPHTAANTLQNQFGDCKDKANLFNALLRSVGIDAHLALVPRFRSAHPNVPGMPFNHAISRVMLSGQPLWVDTTDDICRFGFLPPGDSGRLALAIDGKEPRLVRLPSSAPGDNELNLAGDLDCSNPDGSMSFTLKAVAKGFADYELRSGSRTMRDSGSTVPLLQTLCRPAMGAFAMEKQTNTEVYALHQDFTFQAQGAAIGMLNRFGPNWLLYGPFWLPREWDLALHERSESLFLNQGYPLTLRQSWVVKLPPNCEISLPAGGASANGPLRWKIGWKRKAPGSLVASLDVTLERGHLEPVEVVRFQTQLKALLQAVTAPAEIKPGERPSGTASREKLKNAR